MKFISRLNQRLGESIRDNVIREVANQRFSGANKVSTTTRIVAILLVSTTYFVATLGVALIVLGYPNIPLMGLGVLSLGAAAFLRPRAMRNTDPTLAKNDAPTLLRLLNQIAEELGAPKIDGVHVNCEFTAYVMEFSSRERVVGIGAPLWLALDPPERLAVLAHEVAHLANEDPARGRLTGAAMETLSRWFELFSPPSLVDHESNLEIIIDDRGIMGQLVAGLFGGAAGTIAFAYEKLIFAESQRAEYLADIMAASIAGASAMQSALKKTILAPIAYDFLSHLYYDGSKEVTAFEGMANAVRDPDEKASAQIYTEAVNTLHTVDSSHPPTQYRIEVVGAAAPDLPILRVKNIDWKRIDDELAGAFSAEEQKTLSRILVQ